MNDIVQIIKFEVVPMPGNLADGATGAYVNIYVRTSSETEALETAYREIEQARWQVLSKEDVFSINHETISDFIDAYEYYEQCLLEGIVLVFHTWSGNDEAH